MIRFGIIGAGAVAIRSATEIARNPDALIVAVADPNQERAKELAAQHDGAKTLGNAEQLLSLSEIDAVYIAVPNHLHVPISMMALQAGKHVLLEKPLALSVEDAKPLADTVYQTKSHFMLGMNQRFTPAVQRAKKLVHQGKIGRVYHCKTYWRRRAGIPRIGSWFTRKHLSGGGSLLDIGVHMIDSALYILDNFDVESVFGATYSEFGHRGLGEGDWGKSDYIGKEFDVDDFSTAIIKLSGGLSVAVDAAWAMHHSMDTSMNVELYGADGALDTYGERLCRQEDDGYHTIKMPSDGHLYYPHASRFHHFVNIILGREEPCVSFEQVLSVQKILDAIYASAAGTKEVFINS